MVPAGSGDSQLPVSAADAFPVCSTFSIKETKMSKKSSSGNTRKIGRNAGSGRFVPVMEAHQQPKTSVVETLPAPKRTK